MKLFMFYPNDYCRMYLVASNIEEVRERAEELFVTYMTNECSWLDVGDPDEAYYIQEKRTAFMAGIKKIREIESGVVIDSHY